MPRPHSSRGKEFWGLLQGLTIDIHCLGFGWTELQDAKPQVPVLCLQPFQLQLQLLCVRHLALPGPCRALPIFDLQK